MNFINKPEDIDIYSKDFFLGKPYLDTHQSNIVAKSFNLHIINDITINNQLDVINGTIIGLHDKTIIDLIIPDSIIEENQLVNIIRIGDNSFMSSRIRSIRLNNNITYIESYAFAFSHLTNIIFNEKLETIGNNSFRNCLSLKTIIFNKNIKHVGYNAFFMCTLLETIIFINYNHQPIKFEEDAFAFCPNLRKIVFTDDNIYENSEDINLENINIFYKKNNVWMNLKSNHNNINDVIKTTHMNDINDVIKTTTSFIENKLKINNNPFLPNAFSHLPVNNVANPNVTNPNIAKPNKIYYNIIIIIVIVIILYILIKNSIYLVIKK